MVLFNRSSSKRAAGDVSCGTAGADCWGSGTKRGGLVGAKSAGGLGEAGFKPGELVGANRAGGEPGTSRAGGVLGASMAGGTPALSSAALGGDGICMTSPVNGPLFSCNQNNKCLVSGVQVTSNSDVITAR